MAASFDILSEVAGTVIAMPACVGAVYPPEAELLVIEAMKMELPVAAPARIRLLALHVQVGAVVREGEALATAELA